MHMPGAKSDALTVVSLELSFEVIGLGKTLVVERFFVGNHTINSSHLHHVRRVAALMMGEHSTDSRSKRADLK